ncbi:MAG: endonuclease/exonuclease/phosphatase family protein [Paludibacteraceae bacterium]|nr:endonuclease/exonuclease/phosphatase family protein [Paludibacteraceae bacterium]
MKRLSLLLYIVLLCRAVAPAQTEVHISNPEDWTASQMSKYAGQTVKFDVPFYICNNYYNHSGQYQISSRRLFSPTNQALPSSAEYSTIVSLNDAAEITLSGVGEYHRMGEIINDLTVKVSSTYSWQYVSGKFIGNKRTDLAKGYPSVDIKGTHTLLACAFNLEYYLVENLGSGSQGPLTTAEQTRQQTKISEALSKIRADIFGFVEVEQGQGALRKLAETLSKATRRHYSWIDDGMSANGTYTKSGYVYCTESVEPVGSMRSNETGVRNRKKMQAFREIETGEIFIFSLNHFKAKSGTGTGLDADQGDGQGIFNHTRKNEAQSVLNDIKTSSNYYQDEDVLIMGDLNAYAKEDPIQILTTGGMTDLHRYFHADSSYSYTFHGRAGYLDHALANESMLSQVTGMTAYHINSDEDDRYTYNGSDSDLTMFRCSDHDPVIVGLRLGDKASPAATSEIELIEGELFIKDAQDGYYRIFNSIGTLIYEGKITNSMFSVPYQLHDLNIINVYTNGEVKQHKIVVR